MDAINEIRVNAADMAVVMYAMKKEGHNHYDTPENIAGDLITDLLHLIHTRGGDTDAKLRMAKMNFLSEVTEQQPAHELTL